VWRLRRLNGLASGKNTGIGARERHCPSCGAPHNRQDSAHLFHNGMENKGLFMIIWNGKGYLVALITFALLVGAEYGSEAVFADERYYQTHGWPLAAALLVSAVIMWFLGTYLHEAGGRVVVDKTTGREMTLGGNDSLFFIPMRFWAPIFAIGAIAALVYKGV
jgi:hypothetical protein